MRRNKIADRFSKASMDQAHSLWNMCGTPLRIEMINGKYFSDADHVAEPYYFHVSEQDFREKVFTQKAMGFYTYGQIEEFTATFLNDKWGSLPNGVRYYLTQQVYASNLRRGIA